MPIPVVHRAFVLIHHPGRGWLILRGNGSWQLPGGHVDKGESLTQTAVRELFEETGIVARPEQLVSVDIIGKRVVFLLSLPNRPVQVTLSKEHSSYQWVPTGDVRCVRWIDNRHLIKARRLNAQNRSAYTA